MAVLYSNMNSSSDTGCFGSFNIMSCARVNIPTLVLLIIYMVVTVIVGLATMKKEDHECTAGPGNLCQGIFLNTQAGYTAIYITVKIIRWLLPLWAIAVIFGIEDNYDVTVGVREQVYINADDSGNFTSAFRPRGTSFNYKHIYNQTENAERPLIPPFGRQTPTSRSPGIESYGSMGKSPKELKTGQTYPKI